MQERARTPWDEVHFAGKHWRSPTARIQGHGHMLKVGEFARISDCVVFILFDTCELEESVVVDPHVMLEARRPIKIGVKTRIMAGAILLTQTPGEDPGPITIGARCVIGPRVLIGPSTSIPDGTIIDGPANGPSRYRVG